MPLTRAGGASAAFGNIINAYGAITGIQANEQRMAYTGQKMREEAEAFIEDKALREQQRRKTGYELTDLEAKKKWNENWYPVSAVAPGLKDNPPLMQFFESAIRDKGAGIKKEGEEYYVQGYGISHITDLMKNDVQFQLGALQKMKAGNEMQSELRAKRVNEITTTLNDPKTKDKDKEALTQELQTIQATAAQKIKADEEVIKQIIILTEKAKETRTLELQKEAAAQKRTETTAAATIGAATIGAASRERVAVGKPKAIKTVDLGDKVEVYENGILTRTEKKGPRPKDEIPAKLTGTIAVNPVSGRDEYLMTDGSFSGKQPGKRPTKVTSLDIKRLSDMVKAAGDDPTPSDIATINEAAAPLGYSYEKINKTQSWWKGGDKDVWELVKSEGGTKIDPNTAKFKAKDAKGKIYYSNDDINYFDEKGMPYKP